MLNFTAPAVHIPAVEGHPAEAFLDSGNMVSGICSGSGTVQLALTFGYKGGCKGGASWEQL
jgi:hypothetical protein